VVEQIAPIAAVMNATSVHSLQRTTPNPLSCPGLTPCVSSVPPPGRLCQPHLWARLTTVASQPASSSMGYRTAPFGYLGRAGDCCMLIDSLLQVYCAHSVSQQQLQFANLDRIFRDATKVVLLCCSEVAVLIG